MLEGLWAGDGDRPPVSGSSKRFKLLTKVTEKGEAAKT
jgi:hypothetical protein